MINPRSTKPPSKSTQKRRETKGLKILEPFKDVSKFEDLFTRPRRGEKDQDAEGEGFDLFSAGRMREQRILRGRSLRGVESEVGCVGEGFELCK